MAESIGELELGIKVNRSGVQKSTQEIKKDLKELEKKPTEVEITAETSKFESKFNGIMNLLKGAGLVAGAKKVIEIGIEFATAANDRNQTIEKAKSMVGSAYGEIEKYAADLNKKFGLNTTNTINMMADFTGAYKGMGLDTATATAYAERMSNAALDYAAALNKTPTEVESIMMSLMRGNTSVADNLSLYGVTADNLKKTAGELKEKGLMPEGMDESAEKFVALMSRIEENAKSLGFTGAYAREVETFGSQTNTLSEQWQTLKENAGTYLLPAANFIVTGLNTIIGSVSDFITGLSETSVSEAVQTALGMQTMSPEEIEQRVNTITGPLSTINTNIATQRSALDAQVSVYSGSLQNLQKMFMEYSADAMGYGLGDMLTSYGDTLNTDELWSAIDKYEEEINALVENAKNYSVSSFLMLWDNNDEDTTKRGQEVAGAISSYYDSIATEIEAGMQRIRELTSQGLESNWANGELEQIQAEIDAMNEQLDGGIEGQMLATVSKLSGRWSSMSVQELTDALVSSTGAETAMMRQTIDEQAPVWIRAMMESGMTQDAAVGEIASMYAMVDKREADTREKAMEMVAAYSLASMQGTIKDYGEMAKTQGFSTKNNDEFQQYIIGPLAAASELVEGIRGREGLSADALGYIALYDQMMQYQGEYGYDRWLEDTYGIKYEDQMTSEEAAAAQENYEYGPYKQYNEMSKELQREMMKVLLGDIWDTMNGDQQETVLGMAVGADNIDGNTAYVVAQNDDIIDAMTGADMISPEHTAQLPEAIDDYEKLGRMYEDLQGIGEAEFADAFWYQKEFGGFGGYESPEQLVADMLAGVEGSMGYAFDIWEGNGGNYEGNGDLSSAADNLNTAASALQTAVANGIQVNITQTGSNYVGLGTKNRMINQILKG